MYEARAMKKAESLRLAGKAVILAIESSCDETAAAVVANGREVLGQALESQIKTHALYGGVVPEIASRSHVTAVIPVVEQALIDARMTLDDIDAIAVTAGPGLVGALLVGISAAKAMAWAKGLPLVGVHHIEGHISANYIAHPNLSPPFLCLVVSGGHTHLIQVLDYGVYRLLGQTLDDAAGEAFDKVARLIDLPYPGGPTLDKLAEEGDDEAFVFTRPRTEGRYDFSFSGLKTQVMQRVNRLSQKGEHIAAADMAASFRKTVVEALVQKTILAAKETKAPAVALAGGVASNRLLRKRLEEAAAHEGIRLYIPPPALCTDNAVMIGSAGFYNLMKACPDDLSLNAQSSMALHLG